MKKMFLLLLLMGSSLLLPVTELFAQEHAEATGNEAEISVEDQKIIELLELLQMMELLQDFQMMTIEEEKK